MVFIPMDETWYCVECQEKDLIWYPSHGSEEDGRHYSEFIFKKLKFFLEEIFYKLFYN